MRGEEEADRVIGHAGQLGEALCEDLIAADGAVLRLQSHLEDEMRRRARVLPTVAREQRRHWCGLADPPPKREGVDEDEAARRGANGACGVRKVLRDEGAMRRADEIR